MTAPEPGQGFAELLAEAYLRMNAALFVSMFGSSEQRNKVGRLVEGKLPQEEAEETREWLDRVAKRLTR